MYFITNFFPGFNNLPQQSRPYHSACGCTKYFTVRGNGMLGCLRIPGNRAGWYSSRAYFLLAVVLLRRCLIFWDSSAPNSASSHASTFVTFFHESCAVTLFAPNVFYVNGSPKTIVGAEIEVSIPPINLSKEYPLKKIKDEFIKGKTH